MPVLLQEAGLEVALHRLYCQLRDGPADEPTRATDACQSFLLGVGVDVTDVDQPVVLRACEGVQAWRIGPNTYLTRQDELFLLDRKTSRVWRRVSRADGAVLRGRARDQSLGALYLHGLASISIGEVIRAATRSGLDQPRFTARIGLDGAELEPSAPVAWLRVGATSFAESGGMLVYAGFLIANLREDIVGAYEAQQWTVIQTLIASAVDTGAVSILASRGIRVFAPLRQLAQLQGSDTEWARGSQELLAMRVQDQRQARRAIRDLFAWLGSLPVDLNDIRTARCHESSIGFLNLLLLARGWLPLGRARGVRIPNAEIEYTVDVYDGKASSLMRLRALITMVTWRREVCLPFDGVERHTFGKELWSFARSVSRTWSLY